MGLDYSYEIVVPARNVVRALLELNKLAPTARRVTPLAVTMPGGDRVVVPFTSNFKSDPVDCSTSDRLELDTSVMSGVDDAVREFCGEHDFEPDEFGRVGIGYIYLTVRFAPERHPRFASLEFTAATSGMSRLFERSASVRAVFTGLTAASGGVCCLLDTESDIFQICWLNGQPVHDTVPGPRFANYCDLAAVWPGQDE
ncbi:hypothetical protein [Streptomyces lushanensis]|uniref:hypothetical protein n=1 Tax=Streptomyces lushanensis TaxID=1434255 RepID=UPI000829B622|nr:hypothetical protein [Streptomyces lushanensis]